MCTQLINLNVNNRVGEDLRIRSFARTTLLYGNVRNAAGILIDDFVDCSRLFSFVEGIGSLFFSCLQTLTRVVCVWEKMHQIIHEGIKARKRLKLIISASFGL